MFGDIYPTTYMGKTTDLSGMMKFQLPRVETYRFKPKLHYPASIIITVLLITEQSALLVCSGFT